MCGVVLSRAGDANVACYGARNAAREHADVACYYSSATITSILY